ncbi:restriction endonuclease subunit S [Lactobacillus delbrueckii subsp. bulgaricus]
MGDLADRVTTKNKGMVSELPLTISAQDGLISQDEFFNKKVASKDLSSYLLLHHGDFAYNKSYSNGYPFGTIKRLEKYPQGVVSSLYIAFKPNSSISSDFMAQYYESNNWHKEIYKCAAEGARNHGLLNVPPSDFFATNLNIPITKSEQLKIGRLLNAVDQTITLHEEKKHQLERLKSALLQKMFADKSGYPDIRFEGFSDEWEQCKLGDVAKINSGKDYKGLQPGKIPVYGTGGYMLSVNDKLSDIDAIGIGRKGTIDKPYYLNAPFWTVDTLFYVTPRGTVDISFMFPLFKNINWKRYDESTGVPSLSKNTIKKIRVSFPQNNEQVKIGDLFQKITQTITLHDQKLNLLKLVKQSLLQNMFI